MSSYASHCSILLFHLGKRKPRFVREVPNGPYTSWRLGNQGSPSWRGKQLNTTWTPLCGYRSETSSWESRTSGKRNPGGNNLHNVVLSGKMRYVQVVCNKVNILFFFFFFNAWTEVNSYSWLFQIRTVFETVTGSDYLCFPSLTSFAQYPKIRICTYACILRTLLLGDHGY